MITLVSYPPAFGLPTGTPFGLKAMILLELAGVDWTFSPQSDPRRMPHQKLPVIRVGDHLIHDSERIRAFLMQQGATIDEGLRTRDKALSLAIIRMVEEHLYFHILADRWLDPQTWPHVRAVLFRDVPRPIRNLIANGLQRNVRRGLWQQGLGRFTPEERLEKAEGDLAALADMLWEQPYLFGDRPTAADASAGAMLLTAMATPRDTALALRVRQDAVLSGYADRMRALLPSDGGG